MKPLSILTVTFILLTFLPSSGLAQITNGPWSQPLNLSHSGAATDPIMVVDSQGTIHVFWTDEFSGPMYTYGDGKQWSTPVPVSVPFEDYTPLLMADSSGYIHAFWIDDHQVLRYANVLARAVPTSAWNPVEILAASAVAFEVEVDAQDRIHLAYARDVGSSEAPAGVYYRQSGPRGENWSELTLLYQSPYFRTLDPLDVHVDVHTTNLEDAQQIFVTWDNRPLGRVYLANSIDGGLHWGEPQEIDKTEQGGGSASPYNLTVYAKDGKVLLVWQTASQDTGCDLYYQWSLDNGESWQPHQRLSKDMASCSSHIYIVGDQENIILLLDSTELYLQAWDGTRWSDIQIQSTLSNFVDPETQQTVHLGCRQYTVAASQLLVIGCSAEAGGDIWWLRRDLTDTAGWFPQESVWQPLTSVTRSESRFLSMAMVADSEERVHVLWSQSGDDPTLSPDSAFYYTRWEGERQWSQPVAILGTSEEPADQPAIAVDPAGHLYVVWRRGKLGEIFFSQARADQAALPSAWADPQRVSSPDQMGSSPEILAADSGKIYIVYAVPLNEGRGIYLTWSEDGGRTWVDPVQVFDAAAAGWVIVDQPRLALTGNGNLHLLWTGYDFRSGNLEPLALAYTHSRNGGQTWSAPETVVENPVVWSRIVGVGDQTVHRLWQELTAGQTTTLWHERSLDNGATWERIAPISIFGEAIGAPSLNWDRAGDLHLLQVVSHGTSGFVLQHWVWDGERWGGGETLALDLGKDTSIGSLASTLSPQGQLDVLLSSLVGNQYVVSREEQLFFTARSVDLSQNLPAPLPTIPASPVVTNQLTLQPTNPPAPTPTPNLALLNANGGSPGNSWTGIMIGTVIAGLIVAVVFGLGIWKARGNPRLPRP